MNFVLKPSLEHMALVKIVVLLWNQNDVWALISKINYINQYSSEEWKTIEERVIQKVTQLSLPHLLKEKVFGFINPIGLQISEWIRFHCGQLHVHLPAEFCWTPQGTVDRMRTAEVLVKDESLDMSTRYKVACIYCLEDNIIQFWNSMPEDLKETVSHDYFSIIIFWSRSMRRRGSHNDYGSEFIHSAVWGNKVAADYLLRKLTITERKESLEMTAKYVIQDADTLCFLISEMNEEQQMKFLRREPYKVLQCFLQWPWQSLFIEIASCMWDFLSKIDFDITLRNIFRKIDDGYKDWNYQNLFREFWQKSPSPLKDSFIDEIDNSWILLSLFDSKDKEIIRLILKDPSFTVKKKLIYSEGIHYFLTRSIRENEWDFIEFIIQECSPSKNEMLKLKEEFEKRMSPYFKNHFATKKPKWDLLFSFSDDTICKCNKRSLEESSSSK